MISEEDLEQSKKDLNNKDKNIPITTLKKFIKRCNKLKELCKSITEGKEKDLEKELEAKFITFYETVQKEILNAFPVKSIINFSTTVKPPDEVELTWPREIYDSGRDDVLDTENGTRFNGNNQYIREKNFTPVNDNDNEHTDK